MKHKREKVVILDFGTQYAMLIARKVREQGTYSEIVPYNTSLEEIKSLKPIGIILSGGPKSVYADKAPQCDEGIFSLGVPVLGICYGMQLMSYALGGTVEPGDAREYGHTMMTCDGECALLKDISAETRVWMSHGDKVTAIPDGFEKAAHTGNVEFCVMGNAEKKLYGVQFHPEVSHTDEGRVIIGNFLDICGSARKWQISSIIDECVKKIQETAPEGQVICGLSGGVDSSVTAALLSKAIPGRVTCIFVDNGLLRLNEAEQVKETFSNEDYGLMPVEAADLFLSRLQGITEPQKKREIIGHTFIDIFHDEALKIEGAGYLAQGTLYPDVIESVSAHGGPTDCIKLHHNVGGLPPDISERFTLIEPLRELFKDEVRRLGTELGLPDDIVWRHPFPGPGLAVRMVGEIIPENLDVLRKADAIFIEEMKKEGLYRKIGQAFVVFLPVQTVGVMGDERSYESVVALRSVDTSDFMTADWTKFSPEFLQKVSGRIISEVKGINRVVYDITSKPPGTIEWE